MPSYIPYNNSNFYSSTLGTISIIPYDISSVYISFTNSNFYLSTVKWNYGHTIIYGNSIVNGLSPNSSYNFTIAAYNPNNVCNSISTISGNTLATGGELILTATDDDTIQISYTTPYFEYAFVSWSNQTNTENGNVYIYSSLPTAFITGLTPNTLYNFESIAYNGNNDADITEYGNVYTFATGAGINANVLGDNIIEVSFNQIFYEYAVINFRSEDNTQIGNIIVYPDSPVATFTNLIPNTHYYFTGIPYNPENIPDYPEYADAYTEPTGNGVILKSIDLDKINVSFGKNYFNYCEITWNNENSTITGNTIIYENDVNGYTITGLNQNEKYFIYAVPYNYMNVPDKPYSGNIYTLTSLFDIVLNPVSYDSIDISVLTKTEYNKFWHGQQLLEQKYIYDDNPIFEYSNISWHDIDNIIQGNVIVYGNNPNVTIYGLNSDTQYFFDAVTYYNNTTETKYGNTYTYTSGCGLNLLPINGNIIHVSFDNANFNYTELSWTSTDGTIRGNTIIYQSDPSANIIDLSANEKYIFTSIPYINDDSPNYPEYGNTYTLPICTDFSISLVNNKDAVITYVNPIFEYSILTWKNSDNTINGSVRIDGSNPTYTVYDLSKNNSYYFISTAYNANNINITPQFSNLNIGNFEEIYIPLVMPDV